ncbi:MAG: phage holin family protein [Methylotenera sp.]
MAKESNMASEGLFASLKNLATTLVAIVHTRLDLLSTDLEEGRQRLVSLMVLTFVSLFCIFIGVVLLAILIAVVFWDSHRLLALSALSGTFLIAGAILGGLAIRTLKTMPRMFEASLAELSKDHQQLTNE